MRLSAKKLSASCLTSAFAIATVCGAMPASAQMVFNRVASFATTKNMAQGEDQSRNSSAEIISANEAGTLLIYTDSPLGAVGLIDLTDPLAPKALGNVDLGGEPTTAQIIGEHAFVAVNTSASYIEPSGKMVQIDLQSKAILAECDLGGQPDSVARAKDGSFLAIAIENERDEDVNEGQLPQAPSGYVVKLPVSAGAMDCAALQKIEVTGLSAYAPEDAEPEYLDINAAGEIVLSMQENNHMVVIGADGKVASHFSAGEVDLTGVDVKRDGRLDFSGQMKAVAREPDGVKWIDQDHFVTANEGDWQGGSRGFTIFSKTGEVIYDSGASFERQIAALGHYPDKRNKKGVELESVEVAQFGEDRLLFVVSERASVIGVYNINDLANPVLTQILPSGISPEGIIAIPSRNLLISANEADLRQDGGAPAHVMVFKYGQGQADYPTILSEAGEGLIGWAALSGLVGHETKAGQLYAISDSFLSGQPSIYTIDASQKPAKITEALTVTRGGQVAQKLDLEGITLDGKGGFWLANEGDAAKLIPHAILNVNEKGEIIEEISLPISLLAGQKRFGLEGISRQGNVLWMAMQREWGDDPKGLVKLLSYNLETEAWGAVHYPLEAADEGAWMGLSEITLHGDYAYIVERDNQIADKAKVKKLYRVALADMKAAPLGEVLPVVAKEELRDFIPDLAKSAGYIVDKVEGFAIDAAGEGFVVTDNDGVDDSSGETHFWSIGKLH